MKIFSFASAFTWCEWTLTRQLPNDHLIKIFNVKEDHNAYHDKDNDEGVNSYCQSESHISSQLRFGQTLSLWLTYRRNKTTK